MEKLPNILVLMVDELAPQFLPDYGHPLVKTPNISSLAKNGMVFDNAYTSSPLCAPARASFMAGRLCPEIDAYDNAAEFPASVPTIAHFLRHLGYQTSLCGKMHFIGPDQLHGFEERLTTDIYPANFSWTGNWDADLSEPSPAGATVRPILEAGPCIRSMQMDYDDNVTVKSIQKLFDLSRDNSEKPFFLVSSFTHPHPPFTINQKYWDIYDHSKIDLPIIKEIPVEDKDVLSQYLYFSHRYNYYDISDEDVRNTRHAYYSMISYTDERIGSIIKTLKETKLDENTIIIFLSDHGEMLGERGMWYKMSMFEHSVRIPMIISGPGLKIGRDKKNRSIVDIAPTVIELAEGNLNEFPINFSGRSMKNAISNNKEDKISEDNYVVISDYSAGQALAGPVRMIKKGKFKLILMYGYDPLLFDLSVDPNELNNLSNNEEYTEIKDDLIKIAHTNHDPKKYNKKIRKSQKERLFLRKISDDSDTDPNWAFVAEPGDENRFVRGGGLKKGAHATKSRYLIPKVKEAQQVSNPTGDPKIIPKPNLS